MGCEFSGIYLSEPGINIVFDDRCKSHPLGPVVKMADTETLLHDVAHFGNVLVAFVNTEEKLCRLLENKSVPPGAGNHAEMDGGLSSFLCNCSLTVVCSRSAARIELFSRP